VRDVFRVEVGADGVVRECEVAFGLDDVHCGNQIL